jgi:hypothetical protein
MAATYTIKLSGITLASKVLKINATSKPKKSTNKQAGSKTPAPPKIK